jgi:hypothetical protein
LKTRWILGASALLMGVAGLAGSFAPQEILGSLGIAATGALPVMVQVMAALYLGFAMTNWMAKDSLIGGIYNRPLAVGNLLHSACAAMALAKAASNHAPALIIVATVIYAVLAIAFGWIVFGRPVKVAAVEPV